MGADSAGDSADLVERIDELLGAGEADAAVEYANRMVDRGADWETLLQVAQRLEYSALLIPAQRLLEELDARESSPQVSVWIRYRSAIVHARRFGVAAARAHLEQALELGLPAGARLELRRLLINHFDEVGDRDALARQFGALLQEGEQLDVNVFRAMRGIAQRHALLEVLRPLDEPIFDEVEVECVATLPGHVRQVALDTAAARPNRFLWELARKSLYGSPPVRVFVLRDVTAAFVGAGVFFFDHRGRHIASCSSLAPAPAMRAVGALLAEISDPPLVTGTCALIQDRFAGPNYCHWVLDWLPRIHICQLAGLEIQGVVGSSLTTTYQQESLAAVGYEADDFIATEGQPLLRFQTIVVPENCDRVFRHPAQSGHPALLSWWRTIADRIAGRATGVPTRRLYLPRRGKRVVINEHEIRPLLGAYGFTDFDPAAHSFGEQVATFRRAESIVGPHGAALANIIFAPENCTVVELFARTGGTAAYCKLANAIGQDYEFLVAPVQRAGGLNDAPITVDVRALEQLLSSRLDRRGR